MIVCWPRSILIFIFFLILTGCYQKRIETTKIHIDRKSLASSFTNAPDPRQKAPPTGEQLLIHLDLDPEMELNSCRVVLYVLFKSLEAQEIEFIPKKHKQLISYFILGEKYQLSQGLLSYKLEVYENNKQHALYHHPMWFEKFSIK